MRFVSLFAGIGGLDLGLERAGMECVAQVEIDPFCRAVLAKHWPDVPRFEDVRDDPRGWPASDMLVGGFPCQEVSNAGRRAGISAARSGLYRQVVRALRVVRPPYALLENVAALLGRGMGRVLGDLAASGYDTEWDCLSACAVGAPHHRDRVFILAHPPRGEAPGLRLLRRNQSNGFQTGEASGSLTDRVIDEFDGFPTSGFVEWLMGFPQMWTDCAALATPSSPKSPK